MFRILVAEDDKGTRRLMQDTLADAGHEPLPAADGSRRWNCWAKNMWT